MATTTSAAAAPGSLEALKRVKATESEWDARLNAARQESEAILRRLRDDGDASVKATEAEADRLRSVRLEKARAETDQEAEAIVADGRSSAQRAALTEGRRPSDKKDAVLDAVLGSFGKD
jgi:vacuolar-type H+-ATPase subunit H